MACSSCAAKNQSRTALNAFKSMSRNRLRKLQPCQYTFEQISEKLETETNKRNQNYLKNALKNYSKNCNLFIRQLNKIFNT